MRAVVAGSQTDLINDARRILLSEGVECHADDVVDYKRLPDRLAVTRPDVVLVFCDHEEQSALGAIQTAHQLMPGPVLAVGEPGISLVRDAMRAGAREFIDASNLRTDLSAAVINIENANQGASKRGRIVSVFSPIGGAGVSTIAANLAIAMMRLNDQGKEPDQVAGGVALLDLNPALSDVGLLLDLTPQHTLADVGRNRERLDQRLLAGAMTIHSSGLHVLPQSGFTYEPGLPRWDIDPVFVRQLFILLRKMYEYVIVDLGHVLEETQLEAMRLSNVVLMASVADVPGLRRVRWAVDTAISNGITRDRFQMVLSRYARRYHLSRDKVEEALHQPLFAEFADDAAAVTAARNEGEALIDMSGRADKAFKKFAASVHGHLLGSRS